MTADHEARLVIARRPDRSRRGGWVAIVLEHRRSYSVERSDPAGTWHRRAGFRTLEQARREYLRGRD